MSTETSPTAPIMAQATNPAPPTRTTLTVTDIQELYRIGAHLARALARLLPHATVGKTLYVRRADMEALMDRAIADGADLWDLAREHDTGSLLAWLRGGQPDPYAGPKPEFVQVR